MTVRLRVLVETRQGNSSDPGVADARLTLLARLIDDAGLFPPARKPMERAISDHHLARAGAHAWVLGRFLCPVSRLDELTVDDGWELGAIFDGADWRADLERVQSYSGPGAIRVLELRAPADQAAAADALTATGAAVFFELPGADALAGLPRSVGAKLRCGGPTAAAFPSPAAVAGFIATARHLGVRFKLTAGLHHPFRIRDEQLGVLQHGFINLLAATAIDVEDLEAVVAEPQPEAFHVDRHGLRWGDASAGPRELARARLHFTAYGSCSFDEPVADLVAAGILTAPTHA
jgi:hypothetical protein